MKHWSRRDPHGLDCLKSLPWKPLTCGGIRVSRRLRAILTRWLPCHMPSVVTLEFERMVPPQPYSATDQENHGARTHAPARNAATVIQAYGVLQRRWNPIAIHRTASVAK